MSVIMTVHKLKRQNMGEHCDEKEDMCQNCSLPLYAGLKKVPSTRIGTACTGSVSRPAVHVPLTFNCMRNLAGSCSAE